MKSALPVTRRRNQGGFALLVIFLIASAVAFSLYQQLPRAAFESARNKEQLLIDRGNQYKRAIEVYYVENKRYPAKLEDLEKTNEKRYLRRRYKDPMTGEDEWRIIHTNGSALTDSLVKKPPTQNANNGPNGAPLGLNSLNNGVQQGPGNNTDGNGQDSTQGQPVGPGQARVNAAVQRRPSDRTLPDAQSADNPFAQNQGTPEQFAQGGLGGGLGGNPPGFDPNDPRTWPPISLTPANAAAGPGNAQNPNAAPRIAPGGAFAPGQPNPRAGAGQGGLALPGIPTQQIPGQLPGVGGQNPQPLTFNTNPLGPNSMGAPLGGGFNPAATNPNLNDNQPGPNALEADQPNPSQAVLGANGQFTPLGNFQQQPQQQQPFQQQPFPARSGANPFGAAFGQQNNNAVNNANPQANNPAPVGRANPSAIDAIYNQLIRPQQGGIAPAGGPVGSPGIAGVASKFEGPSIKSYRERIKYQEWEFVYEPALNRPGQPGPGAGQPGQNQQGQGQLGNQPGQNPFGQNPAGRNPFGQP